MWIRDLKILKQKEVCDGVFVTLFELVLWNKKTRYHTTLHRKQLTKEDFENNYKARDYNYCTKNVAEYKFEVMTKPEINIRHERVN